MAHAVEPLVACDFETSGHKTEYALQPWRYARGDAWPTAFTYMWDDGTVHQRGGLMPTAETLRAFFTHVRDTGATIVAWNAVFEAAWCIAMGFRDEVRCTRWLDPMLLWRHLEIEPEYDMDRSKKKSYGLKLAVAEQYPQYAGYDEQVDFHDPSPAARKVLLRYNRLDVLFTLRLAQRYIALLQQSPRQWRAAQIEARAIPFVAEANVDGMPVDPLVARHLEATLTNTAAHAQATLAEHGLTETIVRSPTKLATLLYDQWGLPVLKENVGKKTGNVSRSTDKEVLHELAFLDPRIAELRKYREALTNRTKFATGPLESRTYNGDGRTYPQAIVFGTYSGRMTYSSKQGKNKDERPIGFALHQEKRGKAFRDIIVAPPGYTLVEFDASGQEFRWMAIASNDVTMLQLCLPGEDPHSFMGARIAHREYREFQTAHKSGEAAAKDGRQLGKVANLSLQYRTSAKKLRVVARVDYNIPLELPESERIRSTYLQSYRGVPVYWAQQIQLTKHRGWVETLAGRRVQVVGNWDGSMGWSMGSTAINYRIQGTGADQKYLAMACLHDTMVKFGVRFAWDLHDGIYFWIPDAVLQPATAKMRHILHHLPYRQAWGLTPPVPLPWDCKIGKAWGSLREYHGD